MSAGQKQSSSSHDLPAYLLPIENKGLADLRSEHRFGDADALPNQDRKGAGHCTIDIHLRTEVTAPAADRRLVIRIFPVRKRRGQQSTAQTAG
jgi:hypothetical protein